jgi:hypothetical protein
MLTITATTKMPSVRVMGNDSGNQDSRPGCGPQVMWGQKGRVRTEGILLR